MYYSEEIIEEVRIQNDIVDVIGDYVHLQKKGASHFGLCPFHHEKTPSFSVSKDKQMYYCFGCGAGGNVFSFIMNYENYSFVEAVKHLASRVNITLPEPEVSEEVKRELNYKQELFETNTLAARFFYIHMRNKHGIQAMKYMKNRDLDDETMKAFGIGYSTFFRDDLLKFLLSKGKSIKMMMDAGLISEDKKKSDDYHDRFFNRVMFPIFDVHGRVIAFGGRALGDGMPKYLNSPETVLFDKSRNLYGLHIARKARRDFMIIVEGYMDVIALHKHGFDNAIASLGTAFTSGHGNLIKRYSDEVIIAFDSDNAGVNASLRAIPILKKSGLSVRVIQMEDYKDPDEYLKNKGAKAFEELLQRSIPSFMFEVEQLAKRYDLNDPEYKTAFSKELTKMLVTLDSKLEIENYLETIVAKYRLNKDGMYELLGKAGNNIGITKERNDINQKIEREKNGSKKKNMDTLVQKEFLSIIVSHYKIFLKVKDFIRPEHFTDDVMQKVAYLVYDDYNNKDYIEPSTIMDKFIEVEEQRELASIFSEEIKIEDQAQLEKLLNDTIKRIKSTYLESIKDKTNEPETLMKLINEKKELINLNITLGDL